MFRARDCPFWGILHNVWVQRPFRPSWTPCESVTVAGTRPPQTQIYARGRKRAATAANLRPWQEAGRHRRKSPSVARASMRRVPDTNVRLGCRSLMYGGYCFEPTQSAEEPKKGCHSFYWVVPSTLSQLRTPDPRGTARSDRAQFTSASECCLSTVLCVPPEGFVVS